MCAAAGSSAGRPPREVPDPLTCPTMGHAACSGDVEPNFGSNPATSANTRDRSSGKIPSRGGANSTAWEQVHSFPRLCWEQRSIAHPLCFGTWRGTRSSPHPRNWAASPRCLPIKEPQQRWPQQTAALSLQHGAALEQPSSSPAWRRRPGWSAPSSSSPRSAARAWLRVSSAARPVPQAGGQGQPLGHGDAFASCMGWGWKVVGGVSRLS